MPLLNRKRIPLTPTIPYDPKRKRKEVWYLRSTNEVFTNYESYINRLTLYNQAIWECEVTGRKNLTYKQALESEKLEHDKRVEYIFSKPLRKCILEKVQFQTKRLDDLVDDTYNYFKENYVKGETIQCKLNEYNYHAEIVDIIHSTNNESHTEHDVPRQPDGRLRFPDAFLHPEPKSPNIYNYKHKKQFEVQLIDEVGNLLEDCHRIIDEDQIYDREKHIYNRLNIQSFIRECCYQDTYMNAPWLIKPAIASTYHIDTTLPDHIQELYERLSKKRKIPSYYERDAEKRAKREEIQLLRAKQKEERDRLREEKRKQSAVKYPVEDLDLPIYRKDPNLNWTLIDMSTDSTHDIPYPSGGRPERPTPHTNSLSPELFDILLAIWSFMAAFSEPLKLSSFSLDEFEASIFGEDRSHILAEYHATLLNVIIRERNEDTMNDIMNGDRMEEYLETHVTLTGWRNKDQLKLTSKWDQKEIRSSYERRGWETVLMGCLNDVATPELVSDLDEILTHLYATTASERERQYPTLTPKQKLNILTFLTDVVNESTLIKNYMDYCQEQISEFRKQKIELNKEAKILASKRNRMDKIDKEEEKMEDTSSSTEEDSDNDSDSSDSMLIDREHRHKLRQEKLKQKQKEREEFNRQYVEQRQVAKVKNQEQRQKAIERRKLEEEERRLRKKEEHLEVSMRRYMTLRIRPLGKDRFNNRYYYFDNIGISNTHGSGKLYVNSPSDGDILLMMERDHATDLPERPWGYGGGIWFIKKLMQEQGLREECEWLEKRIAELSSETPPSEYRGWWKYYEEPEELEKLLSWLNPKGIREYKLKNEILKHQSVIIDSMNKRAQVLQAKSESSIKRSTRSKSLLNKP
ncbi:ATP-utilizing chromatin assembly and remodelling N-terminal-domain-containing protein [Cokeromyces recurvatus]|uniref:ATP-utilizing chromatin assembly and remodelling N-terminal-domain-containing protein n=1 Tax=Cokeromyces recurvatus TaxID=90255 RepID=UPI00221FCDFA|nr:ATP-utilizing chromatin assembly and remodelling N-terminal-domain-containing protein [Cokeromyces recurvatus]KAI7898906.1 ATP-utilizing chromatin assembly and remodelling N-terminal-domain-containing protein [Cokeromyces recurvatus]